MIKALTIVLGIMPVSDDRDWNDRRAEQERREQREFRQEQRQYQQRQEWDRYLDSVQDPNKPVYTPRYIDPYKE